MKVQLFIPCFIDQLFPETAFNMIKVLKKAGCEVDYNPAQTCCGQPAFNAGYWDISKDVAEKFTRDFNTADYIVCPGGSCAGFVRNYYGKMLTDDKYEGEIAGLKKNMFEFTEFLVHVLKVSKLGASLDGTAAYHDACGALRECNVKTPPRMLLANVDKLQLVETADCETCCGFGGTFAVKYDPIAVGMGEQKVENAMATGAEILISTDMSCLMHMDGYIKKRDLPLKVMHIADVLSSGW